MGDFKQKAYDRVEKIVERVVKREMDKWPPDCMGPYYQPARPVMPERKRSHRPQ